MFILLWQRWWLFDKSNSCNIRNVHQLLWIPDKSWKCEMN
jgi:hypothetical protein